MTRLVLIAVVLLAALAPAAEAAKDDVVLVSRGNGPNGRAGDDHSFSGAMSADGRLVVFLSFADNLSGEDDNRFRNVFVRDLRANTITLASRAGGAGGEAANADSFSLPRISGDGRFVAFDTKATNLTAEAVGGVRQVYVRDLLTDTTTLVSRASGKDGAVADQDATLGSISADGRLVAFVSSAGNLSGDMTQPPDEVYVRDMRTNTTTLVSRATGEAGAVAANASSTPVVSADGRIVAFASQADNLSDADSDGTVDAYVRDLQAHTTTLVSRASGAAGAGGDDASFPGAISADGRVVAFRSQAANLSTEDVDGVSDAFVRDLRTNTTTLVSRASGAHGAAGDSDSAAFALSADGRYVGFNSLANNLRSDDNDTVANAYVRDLRTNATIYVSRATGPAGEPADDSSLGFGMSADGRFVPFVSLADNLSAADRDGTSDVFVRDVLGAPPPPPPPPHDTTPPAITRVGLARRRLRFTLSETADVRAVIARCRRHHCRRARSFARRALAAGPHRIRIRRALAPGRYRVTVLATDAAGNAATVRSRVMIRRVPRPRPRARRGPT